MDEAKTIRNLLLNYGFNENLSMFMASQAGHESAGFTSYIYHGNNNCFGMKYAGQSTAKGEKNGYAYYDSLSDCVYDFVIWWSRTTGASLFGSLFISDLDDYVHFLKDHDYFEDTETNYLKGCQNFYNQYFAE